MKTKKVTIQSIWRGKEVKVKGKLVVNKTAYEIGLVVEGQAKLLCAVNWGYLAASITTQAIDHGTEPENPSQYQLDTPHGKPASLSTFDMTIQAPEDENEILVGTPVEYGPYVEFGTIKMDAQPFLRPALDLARGKTLTMLEYNGKIAFKEYM